MIEETGLIVEVDDQYAWVEAASSNSCSHCAANQACGTASLQKWFKRRPNRLRVINHQHIKPGERVVIGIPEQALVKGSFMIYMLPLLFLIGGAFFGSYLDNLLSWGHKDAASMFFGLLGLFGSFRFLQKYYTRKSGQQSQYQPVILRRAH
jgi:sigma-E factor negative regulatory protein RseC